MMFRTLFKKNQAIFLRSNYQQNLSFSRQLQQSFRIFSTQQPPNEETPQPEQPQPEQKIEKKPEEQDQKQDRRPQYQQQQYQQQKNYQKGPKSFLSKKGNQQRSQDQYEVTQEGGQDYQRREEESSFRDDPYSKTQLLEQIVGKYKDKKQAQWQVEDISKFIDELSGKGGIPKTKVLDYQTLSTLKTQDLSAFTARISIDFQKASENLKDFSREETGKWQRDKFDSQFLKYVQRYLNTVKSSGQKKLDVQVFKDLNSMTRKYIELLGTVEFNKQLQEVLYEKLNLDHNHQFQAFVTDLLFNTNDLSTSFRVRAVILEKFLFLTLQLNNPSFYQNHEEVKKMFLQELEFNLNVAEDQGQIFRFIEDPEFMLTFNTVTLSKNHNFFAQVDSYMKEYASIIVGLNDKQLIDRLEKVLNKEIVLVNKDKQLLGSQLKSKDSEEHSIHHDLLAQPEFQFRARADKLKTIHEYQDLIKDLDKTREIKDLLEFAKDNTQLYLKLLSSSQEFFQLLQEIDKEQEYSHAYDKLSKIHDSLNEQTQQIILDRYGISGVNLDNLEQIYNPLISGFSSLVSTRNHLISQGMNSKFADNLAQQYILKLEDPSNHLVQVMDLFSSDKDQSKTLNILMKTKTEDIAFNYTTFSQFQHDVATLAQSERFKLLMQFQNLSKPFSQMGQGKVSGSSPSQTRGFSTKQTKEQIQEKVFNEVYSQNQSESSEVEKPKSNFFDFIKKIDEIDKQKKTEDVKQDYDLSDIDFSFEKISNVSDLKSQKTSQAKIKEEGAVQIQQEPLSEQRQQEMKLRNDREKRVYDSKKKYNYSFFKNFAFSGPDAMTLSQKSLEEYILSLEQSEDIQALLISMVNSAYELNSLIPNVESLFYQIFCSPITTKELRQAKDKDDILIGNIFAERKVDLTYFGYKSLLETLILHPKKKHFMKIIAHMQQFSNQNEIDPHIINLIIKLGITNKWPVQSGKAIRFFIQNDYKMTKESFQEFVLFLERCKGYEEDAKRFIFLTSETEHLDFTYDLIRPIFLRSIKTKSGNEILKIFEQFRKNIKLNKASKELGQQEKSDQLSLKKKNFYDGLLSDLILNKAFALAQVVYGEKMREKFQISVNDHLIGLDIFAFQKKIDEFQELFGKILSEKEKINLDSKIAEDIGRNLLQFDADKEKFRRLDMAEKLQKKVVDNRITMTANLFDSLINVYTETQQWRQVIDLIHQITSLSCKPEIKTLNYLKKNLLYCFEPQTRSNLKEAIEQFEDQHFLKPQASAVEIQADSLSSIPSKKDFKLKVTKRERPRDQQTQ